MAIWCYTDKEWGDLPHMVLTRELDWDPSQLDLALEDDDNWYYAVSDFATDPFTNFFDEHVDYQHWVEIQSTEVVDSLEDVLHCYAVHNHDTTPVPNDNMQPPPTTQPHTVTAKERERLHAINTDDHPVKMPTKSLNKPKLNHHWFTIMGWHREDNAKRECEDIILMGSEQYHEPAGDVRHTKSTQDHMTRLGARTCSVKPGLQ